MSIGAADAHACGEHELGYATGVETSSRLSPAYSSGKRPSLTSAASSNSSMSTVDSSTKPYRISPAAAIAVSCGHTEPLW